MSTRPYRQTIPPEILALSQERDLLRRRGQYARADLLKQRIEEAGFVVKDNPHGAYLIMLPGVEVDGRLYRVARDIPSQVEAPDTCTFSIHILARNAFQEARRCVESVLRYAGDASIEILLFDNASQDGLDLWADAARQQESRLHVLRATRTMGAADAQNACLKLSRGRYILLLDPTLELTGDIFTPLARALEDDEVGIVGAHGFRTDDLRHFEASQEEQVEAVDGSCMAFRRELVREIGFFDERYRFARYMDIDFSFAVRDLGLEAVVVSDLPLKDHAEQLDSGFSDSEQARLTKRNFYRFLGKWGERDDLLLEEEEEE
uniref:Glycosyltransferase 2-like domain-containing protein n=1 Tax=Thermosporothrix sp. COM3 TaxID=2490863 RepID=A0A455SM85_9CHLR|nr:hypothetical protein KTC_32290 [Thermosporothrix sp. COM3]